MFWSITMIKKINCIEIPVSDMNKSTVFYEKVLGLDKSYEHPVWTSFDVGGTSLAIAVSGTKGQDKDTEICRSCTPCVLRYAAGKGGQTGKPTAMFVLYLSVEDLDEKFHELKEKGVEFISEPREQAWGGRTALMLDPDRNILVLSEENGL
jgi:predicted enzyme related to lactoylglutathione lyase